MIVHEFADKGVVCGQTWAAMCLVVDHEGSVTMRGFKGSVFNKLSSAVRSELVVSGGQPGSQWRPSEVRSAARILLQHMLQEFEKNLLRKRR